MYGLAHRFQNDALANVSSIGASATVLVVDRDPATLVMAERAIAGHYEIIVAADAGQALALIDERRPDVVMLDMTLSSSEVATVTVALAACDELDSTPIIMLDPDQPMNAVTLRKRIDEAVRVTRRVYLGGGLRNRLAA
jgi:PleD family two-component response regulator